MKQYANDNSSSVAEYAKSCPEGHCSFFGLGEERWRTTLAHKPHGLWSRAAEEMMNTVVAIWHPVLCGTSLLSRGSLKSNGAGKTSKHFNAEPDTAELLLRSVVSVYQYSFYGAVADWCEELSQRDEDHPSPSTRRRPVAEVTGDQAQQVPSEGVSSLTNGPPWSQRARQHSITIPNVHVEGCGTTSSCQEDTYP